LTDHCTGSCLFSFHPERSFPLNNARKPAGGSLSEASKGIEKNGSKRKRRRRVFIGFKRGALHAFLENGKNHPGKNLKLGRNTRA
jgi:hypothetical protein